MYRAVIAGYYRSPFTLAKKGALIDIKPDELLSEVVKDLISKTKVNLEDIKDVIIGCAFPEGEQGFNIGKLVTFLSDMNVKTAGTTINRWCGSSMEAFASQSLACIKDLGIDQNKVNLDGGALALGHPLGATGARITGKVAQLLKRENKKYALATQCIGLGMGIATIIESVE